MQFIIRKYFFTENWSRNIIKKLSVTSIIMDDSIISIITDLNL